MRNPKRRIATLAVLLAVQAIATAAPEHNPVAHESRTESDGVEGGKLAVIVKLRRNPAGASLAKLSSGSDRASALSGRTGLKISFNREISDSMLASSVDVAETSAADALERLRADAAVEYAVPDRRRFAQATNPSDPLFSGQWYLKNTEVSSVDAIGAWDTEIGSTGIVIAVLDTGVLYDHPDLGRGDSGGKLLPGYDFVSGTAQANDGGGRDADPSDPGDWIDANDKTNAAFTNCDSSASSWHGTRVSGMIGARTNNAAGVAGLSWNSFILPVRVLGKCGGTDSDIIAGMRWAAGLPVSGVPTNPTPARILNLSLGATGACEPSYRDTIDELTARKVLVVISAGNEGTMVSSPANCPGVAAIAAIRHAGSKVGFSNLGPEVAIAAPGGNCVNVNGGPCLFSLDTTSDSGPTAPGAFTYTDQATTNLGTSFSAPIVSGIAALMLARNANLSTSQMLARLREGARPFPTTVSDAPTIVECHVPVSTADIQLEQCLCTENTCGAGMANATGALIAADRPIAAVATPGAVFPGQNIALNAAGSAASCGRTLATFAWTVLVPTTNPPAIVGANTSNATVIAPTTGAITVRVTVTDNLGKTDSATVLVEPSRVTSAAPAAAGTSACATPVVSGPTPGAVTPTPPPVTPPSPGGGSSGGGGGSLEFFTLFLLGLMTARVARRR
ncbi:MAG: S8 family serine peptidase [Pseudomonadota bacterium]